MATETLDAASESTTIPEIGKTIRILGDLLGEIIVSQAGDSVFRLEEEIRALSKAWHGGDDLANAKLGEIMTELAHDLPTASEIVKAFSTYFQLVNLAEEYHRVQILRNRENRAFVAGSSMDESIDAAVATLKREGFSATDLQDALNRMLITPVFTAHPTESRRKTTRQILKRVSTILEQMQSLSTLDFEQTELVDQLKSHIVLLWQSDETRNRRPTVMDEVRNTGLYFFETTLFDVVPKIYEELDAALVANYPEAQIEVPSFLNYGSWIGGDRDGNPLVTNDVTAATLTAQKDSVLERYESDVFELYELLSVSQNRADIDPNVLESLQSDMIEMDVSNDDVVTRFELEPYRQKLILMHRKLQVTRKANRKPWGTDSQHSGYPSATEFIDDLVAIRESLVANKGRQLVQGMLSRLIRRVQVFGFHLATLDVRQHANSHRAVITEVFTEFEIATDYESSSEAAKVELLSRLIKCKRPLTAQLNFTDETNQTLSAFRLIAQAQQHNGQLAMQTYIISMTESVSNMLEVLLLMKDAGLFGKLDLVPLFETVNDLKNAPETMAALFANDVYRQHLELRSKQQQIMIGYSDSNKDGGYLQANWMLFTAQRQLANTCAEHEIGLTLFHGRGGSLGRGGGPANRAILSQPHESVNGRIRVTEQGEVVSSRYSRPAIARRHLQQLLHAGICSTGKRPNYESLARWSEIMDEISGLAYEKYRELVEHESFIDYFLAATPVNLVENLNIGSRPSRRKSSGSIDDLRAIPWVFSWTQSRANISSWYGIGSALRDWIADNSHGLVEIQGMYKSWPFFTTLFKNVHLGLGRADMDIAGLYAQLAPENSTVVFDWIADEFELTCDQVLNVTGDKEILDTESWLQHSIRMRNPYVDPLNYIQVALLERMRNEPEIEAAIKDEVSRVLVNSVNGIAAGLQNVG